MGSYRAPRSATEFSHQPNEAHMSIFLTGANGYVGGTVALRLIRAGYAIRGLIGDDAQGLEVNPCVFDEDTPFVVAASKQPRRDIELKILAAAGQNIRSVVICPSTIYGTGTGVHQESVQIPWLVRQAQESGVVRIVGTGVNRWSNVHVLDVAELYLLALQKAPAGAFY